MSQLTKEDLVEAIKSVFLDPTVISAEMHERHHRQYEEDLKVRAEDKCNRNRIRNTVIGGLILSFLTSIGLLLWYGVTVILERGGG